MSVNKINMYFLKLKINYDSVRMRITLNLAEVHIVAHDNFPSTSLFRFRKVTDYS